MEIQKTLCDENPPFTTEGSSTITFKLRPGIYKTSLSYINIPVSIGATSPNNLEGSVANPYFNMKTPISVIVGSVRLTVDGTQKSYTGQSAALTCALAPYEANVDESYTEAYFSGIGIEDTYPIKAVAGQFRELRTHGGAISTNKAAYLRLPLRKLMSGFCLRDKDLRKATDIEFQLQLQNPIDMKKLVAQSVPQFAFGLSGSPVGATISTNTLSLTNMGIADVAGAFPAGNSAGNNVFTFGAARALNTFTYKVGDALRFGTLGASRNIVSITYSGSNTITGVVVDGAAINAGNDTIAVLTGNAAGGTALTLSTPAPRSMLPFGVGDTVNFTGGGGIALTAITLSAGGYITVLTTGGGLDNNANGVAGTTVPTISAFQVTDANAVALSIGKPIELLPGGAAGGATFYSPAAVPANTAPTTIINMWSNGGNTAVALSRYFGGAAPTNNAALTDAPIYLGVATANIVAGTPITSLLGYTEDTLKMWVGQPVKVMGKANVTTVLSRITSITFTGGNAVFTLAHDVAITGTSAGLCMYAMGLDNSWTYTVSFNDKFEMVNYRYSPALAAATDLGEDAAIYSRWSQDGAAVLQIPANSTAQYSFILDPLTAAVAIALNPPYDANAPTTQFISDVGGLVGYRIQIDGYDTTDREITLNNAAGNRPWQSMKTERLITGFSYLDTPLHSVTVAEERNIFSQSDDHYVILQDIPLDAKAHRLTLTLRAGSAPYTTKNLRLYKYIRDRM